jgi:hypothetical protein
MPRQLKLRAFFQPTIVSDSDEDDDPIQSPSGSRRPSQAPASPGDGTPASLRPEPSRPAPAFHALDAWRCAPIARRRMLPSSGAPAG